MSIGIYFQGGIAMQDLLDPEEQKIIDSFAIDLQTLQTAMGNFSLDNILGQGGFRIVYKVCKFNVASSFGFWLHLLCCVKIHVSILYTELSLTVK